DHALEQHQLAMFFLVGRLQPGVPRPSVEAQLNALAQQLDRDYGMVDRNEKRRRVLLIEGGKMLPLRKEDLPFFTSFLTIMASLVMLLACANVANMMLARA